MQSLSGHYLMRQQVPMVFSLHLVYLSTAACISEEIKLGLSWRKDFYGSKVKHKSQNVTFCELAQSICKHWVATIDAPTSAHSVFTSFSLSRRCCLPFCRNKFGLMLAQGYFKGQKSRINHKLQLLWLCLIWNHRVVSTRCAIKYPWSFYFFSLSKYCCLHFWRKKFGSMLA